MYGGAQAKSTEPPFADWKAALERCNASHSKPMPLLDVGEAGAEEAAMAAMLGATEDRGDYALAAENEGDLMDWVEALALGMAC
eukprot:SAG11_NODE_2972_length_2801_cov_1.695041_2_plen_84_part_00